MNSGRYHSPLRAQLYAATRERIVRAAAAAAGQEALDQLAVAEVARRAGVSERTIYRHFPTVTALHEAVLAHLEAGAGWPEGELDAAALPELTRRAFVAFARHRAAAPLDPPSVVAERARRRRQIAAALRPLLRGLPRERAVGVTAVIGVLSSAESYRQLVEHWALDGRAAGQAAAWAVETLLAALAPAPRRTRSSPPPERRPRRHGTRP